MLWILVSDTDGSEVAGENGLLEEEDIAALRGGEENALEKLGVFKNIDCLAFNNNIMYL